MPFQCNANHGRPAGDFVWQIIDTDETTVVEELEAHNPQQSNTEGQGFISASQVNDSTIILITRESKQIYVVKVSGCNISEVVFLKANTIYAET